MMGTTQVRAETQVNNAWTGGTNYFLRTDGSTPAEGDLDLGSNKITNLADPVNPQDAVTKSFLDIFQQGLDPKDAVRAGSEVNVDLASTTDPGAIDGVTLSDGDRVLLKEQTDPIENGIYVADTALDPSTWTRAVDMDEDSEINGGEYTFVKEGTTNADSGFVVTSDDPVLGTDAINWGQFTGAGDITAGDGLTKSGNTLDVVAGDNSLTVNADDIVANLDDTLNDPTIEVSTQGLRVGAATQGDLLIGQNTGSGEATTFQTLGGDISNLAADGTVTIATAGNVITSTGTGIKLNKATAGYVILGKGTAGLDPDVDFTELTGDVQSILADGTVTLASDIVKDADVRFREAFSGDGTTTDFTLSNAPVTETNTGATYKELVFLNGVLQVEGSGDDYTRPASTTVSFENAPLSGDPIRVMYIAA